VPKSEPATGQPPTNKCPLYTALVASRRRFCFPKSPQWHKDFLRPVEPHKGGGRVVLNNLSEQIRECLEHAEECARKAAELPNSSRFRQDFLQLKKRWFELARSIEFGESVDRFTKNSLKPNIKPSRN
jgi:hypothetical protein